MKTGTSIPIFDTFSEKRRKFVKGACKIAIIRSTALSLNQNAPQTGHGRALPGSGEGRRREDRKELESDFYARKQNASRVFAIVWASVRLSVCLSVRLSVCHTRGLYQNGAS